MSRWRLAKRAPESRPKQREQLSRKLGFPQFAELAITHSAAAVFVVVDVADELIELAVEAADETAFSTEGSGQIEKS